MSEENYTNEGNYTDSSFNNEGNYTDSGFNAPVDNQPEGGKGMAVASMVLGIVSIVMLCCSQYISLPCAIIGLILGIMYKKNNGKNGMATAGVVCSIVSLVISILAIIASVVFLGAVGGREGLNELLNELQQYQ